MKRVVQDLKDGRFKITEKTGEIHYTAIERPMDEGYRLFNGVPFQTLTQEQIDTTDLPFFNVDTYTVYPAENETLLPTMFRTSTLYGRSIAERVARVKIAFNLNLFDTEDK